MKFFRHLLSIAAVLAIGSISADAVPLRIMTLNTAPACLTPFCVATTAAYSWPIGTSQRTSMGTLQTRTITPLVPVPAKLPLPPVTYMYRITATAGGSTECVNALTFDFGPDVPIASDTLGPVDVFVVNEAVGAGPLAKVKSVDRTGNKIAINFEMGVCWSTYTNSAIVGLKATGRPVAATAKVIPNYGPASADVGIRTPAHLLLPATGGRVFQ